MLKGVEETAIYSLKKTNASGDPTFMCVFPTSSTETLVEYTLFSKKILEKDKYKIELENYIKDYLKIECYEIAHKESGVIPMTLAKFSRNPNFGKRMINIGTAGKTVRPNYRSFICQDLKLYKYEIWKCNYFWSK